MAKRIPSLEGRLGYRLRRLVAAFRGSMHVALRSTGISPPQYTTMVALSTNPGSSNAALARICFVTPQTMHEIIRGLEDDDFRLYESRAIIRYLDERLDGPRLVPADIHDRALMDQWMSVEHSYFSGPALQIMRELVFGHVHGKAPDMDVVEAARESVGTVLDVTEKALAHHPYLGGKAFSLADICWMPYVHYTFAAKQGDLFTSRPAMNAWWERVSSRPSWKKVAG